jgi:hypothetical protein
MNLRKELNDKISSIMEKHNAFFCFSDKQFQEGKKENCTYVDLGAGLVCQKENVKLLQKEMTEVINEYRKKDIELNGIDKIIKRELANYEAYYTGDISDTVDALEDYNVTIDQVRKVYNKTVNNHNN